MRVELIFHVICNLKIGWCLTGFRPLLEPPLPEASDPETVSAPAVRAKQMKQGAVTKYFSIETIDYEKAIM